MSTQAALELLELMKALTIPASLAASIGLPAALVEEKVRRPGRHESYAPKVRILRFVCWLLLPLVYWWNVTYFARVQVFGLPGGESPGPVEGTVLSLSNYVFGWMVAAVLAGMLVALSNAGAQISQEERDELERERRKRLELERREARG